MTENRDIIVLRGREFYLIGDTNIFDIIDGDWLLARSSAIDNWNLFLCFGALNFVVKFMIKTNQHTLNLAVITKILIISRK